MEYTTSCPSTSFSAESRAEAQAAASRVESGSVTGIVGRMASSGSSGSAKGAVAEMLSATTSNSMMGRVSSMPISGVGYSVGMGSGMVGTGSGMPWLY